MQNKKRETIRNHAGIMDPVGITGPATAHTFREFTHAFIREKVFAVSPVMIRPPRLTKERGRG